MLKKKLSWMLVLLPATLHAADLHSSVVGLVELLQNPDVSAAKCVEPAPAENKIPKIKKGEVKITYSCDDFPTPARSPENELEKEEIKFYVDESLGEELSLRSRVNLENPNMRDVTVKFRPKSLPLSFDTTQYEKLKSGEDDGKFNLKCEADVSLGAEGKDLKSVNSCSLTTTSDGLTADHQAFASMSSGVTLKKSLADYKSVSVESVSWKMKHASFRKPISFEKWLLEDKTCILEASAKFEDLLETPSSLKASSEDAMKKLKGAVNAMSLTANKPAPVSEQGNKTNKALKSGFAK